MGTPVVVYSYFESCLYWLRSSVALGKLLNVLVIYYHIINFLKLSSLKPHNQYLAISMSQWSRHGLAGPSQGPTMLQSRCQVVSFPEFRVPFQVCRVVGRIQFLGVVGLRFPCLSGCHLGLLHSRRD